jgi:hypothetical protein
MKAAFRRPTLLLTACLWLLQLGGCSPVSLLIGAAGVATDTSMTWDIVKHVHAKLTEDDPRACFLVNSVQHALNGRCGQFEPGSLRVADIANSGYSGCLVAIATRDPKLWPVLPELLDKGAPINTCAVSPLVELAALQPCPDFASASPAALASIRVLAQTDPRAVRHDVMRMLSCPKARAVGLDHELEAWLDRGALEPAKLSFSPLDALHPDMLVGRFGRELETAGHTAQAALGSYDGELPSGYEEALRLNHWAALDWWLYRLPQLANRVPPMQGGQLAWVPLQRVLVGNFMVDPGQRRQMVEYLMAHGASPWQRLPFSPDRSVVNFAESIHSPLLALLDPPLKPAAPAAKMARGPGGDVEARVSLRGQALRAP